MMDIETAIERLGAVDLHEVVDWTEPIGDDGERHCADTLYAIQAEGRWYVVQRRWMENLEPDWSREDFLDDCACVAMPAWWEPDKRFALYSFFSGRAVAFASRELAHRAVLCGPAGLKAITASLTTGEEIAA